MVSGASAVTDSDLDSNGSVVLSDIQGETVGTKVEALVTTPPFTQMISSDISVVGLDSVSLHQNAVNLATKLVGTSYLWGGKGFDYQTMKFADAETIASGYTYYDPLTGTNKIGKGVDCSGLVFWSFNKAYGATKYKDTSNPVYYEGAAGQWSDSSRFRQKSTSVPSKDNLAVGDLLFIGTVNTKSPDHVGIYMGNGNVIHAKGSATIEIKTLDGWLNLPVDSTRKYRDCVTGYGSVVTSEPPESATFSTGDSVEVQNTNPLGLKVRDSPAGNKTGNVCDGTRGTILDGPQSAFLEELTYTWWKVRWDDGQVGWSTERHPVSGGVYYFKKVIPTTGSIAITTTQTGASVYLDGVYQGTTPVTLHLVSAGTHTVKLTLSGYEDYEESVRVYAGQTASITTTMQSIPTTGSIAITTTPTGASVYLDGVYKGITPVTLHSVSAGTYTVKLTLSGYEDYEESVRVYAGQTASITTTMQSIPTTGSIAITTTPAGASVYLDGVYKGTTPFTLHSVSAGTHTVKLTLSGYEDYEESVRVYAGQTASITTTMQSLPTTGSIFIQPQSSTLAVGQTQAFTIMLDAAPDGLSGFNMTISLIDPPAYWRPSPDPDPSAYWRPSPPPDPRDDGPTSTGSPVGELIGVTYPQWAKLPINSSFPSDSVFIQAVDIDRSVEPGETNVPLFTIIVRGNAPGTALLRVNVTKIEDDIGGRFVPAATDATLIVHNILPFPNPVGGTFPAPTDLDGDGLYEDLDGNGFVGFNDVVIYYQNMDFIERNQPLAAFDYDGSGFIGFNDVVWLYQRV